MTTAERKLAGEDFSKQCQSPINLSFLAKLVPIDANYGTFDLRV